MYLFYYLDEQCDDISYGMVIRSSETPYSSIFILDSARNLDR